jgi:hypothetical protein
MVDAGSPDCHRSTWTTRRTRASTSSREKPASTFGARRPARRERPPTPVAGARAHAAPGRILPHAHCGRVVALAALRERGLFALGDREGRARPPAPRGSARRAGRSCAGRSRRSARCSPASASSAPRRPTRLQVLEEPMPQDRALDLRRLGPRLLEGLAAADGGVQRSLPSLAGAVEGGPRLLTRPRRSSVVRRLEHLRRRAADHHLAGDHLGALELELGEILPDPLGRQLV